jgi:DNA replication and repair protein RecF
LYIKGIKLKTFRNYHQLDIDFVKNLNIIYGENAQGKTNILESIFLCASGRSHRTSKDSELVKIGESSYHIELEVQRVDRDTKIEISYDLKERKKIRINEISEKRIGNLMGNLNTVIFSPENLDIVKNGPSERRRFLDMSISQIKPSYFFDLQQYSKILSHRNLLLKEIQIKSSLLDTLEIWNKKLAYVGSRIINARKNFIRELNIKAKNNHYKLTNGMEKLNIVYNPSINIEGADNDEEIKYIFEKTLEKSQNKELLKCTTLFGPQRDDCDILLNGVDIKMYGSQGQQRTSILSIKLSEVEIMKRETGEFPVLLLDDVMSELDQKRQEYLLNNISNVQAFITCTDKSIFSDNISTQAKFYKVQNGQVV